MVRNPKVAFLEAATEDTEESRAEARRILSTLSLDELIELMLSSAWIRNVVGRRVQEYENGVVTRHDAGRPDHD